MQLYDEVSALVTSVLDGFNVAIMAYGQTGSGKTFTMEGPEVRAVQGGTHYLQPWPALVNIV